MSTGLADRLNQDSVGDSARDWLAGEVAGGRLSPALDDSQLAAVAGILLGAAGGPRTPRKNKTAAGIASAAVSQEVAGGSSTDLPAAV
jgi:hypothetical protein